MSPSDQIDLLIASIGARDPETASGPTGPLRAARELRPNRVYLLAHTEVKTQASATAKRISAELNGAKTEVLDLTGDPADLDSLLLACSRLLEGIPTHADETVAVCATSGTPQLTLALTLAASARWLRARHFQALDPEKTDRAWREFNPDVLWHHNELETGLQMLADCRFVEAAAILSRRVQSEASEARAHRPAIRAAFALARALQAADGLDPKAAQAQLNISASALPAAAAHKLGQLRQWFQGLTRSKRQPQWAVELAARARRELHAERAPQALVAAAMALEAALTVQLRARYLNPDKLRKDDLSRLPQAVRAGVRTLDAAADVYRIEGAERRSEALAELDAAYHPLHQDPRRKALLEARNDLVHAAKSPSLRVVQDSLKFLEDLCRGLGWPAPSACPSAPQAIGTLVKDLRQAAGLG